LHYPHVFFCGVALICFQDATAAALDALRYLHPEHASSPSRFSCFPRTWRLSERPSEQQRRQFQSASSKNNTESPSLLSTTNASVESGGAYGGDDASKTDKPSKNISKDVDSNDTIGNDIVNNDSGFDGFMETLKKNKQKKGSKRKTFIVKPAGGSEGNGIFLVQVCVLTLDRSVCAQSLQFFLRYI
jgi:hypothetical protein